VWDPPAWWSWLWAATIVVLVAVRLIGGWQRRRATRVAWAAAIARAEAARRAARALRVPSLPVPRPASTGWQPVPEPMGPVSGWPHALASPDAAPNGSPEDRPDLAFS